jgi:hypothetical protein
VPEYYIKTVLQVAFSNGTEQVGYFVISRAGKKKKSYKPAFACDIKTAFLKLFTDFPSTLSDIWVFVKEDCMSVMRRADDFLT